MKHGSPVVLLSEQRWNFSKAPNGNPRIKKYSIWKYTGQINQNVVAYKRKESVHLETDQQELPILKNRKKENKNNWKPALGAEGTTQQSHRTVACVHPVVSDALQPHGLQPVKLLGPCNFSSKKYWSGLPFSFSRGPADPGIKPTSLLLLHRQVGSLPLGPP